MHFAEDKKEEEELTDIISLQAVNLGLFREKRIMICVNKIMHGLFKHPVYNT